MHETAPRTSQGMAVIDEAEEWQRALQGDGSAFGRLFDAHQGRVYQHASRMLPDRHDAEDVLAGAFLELWRCRRKVRLVDGSVLPWLLVTTTNLSRNRQRGLRRYSTFLANLPRTERAEPAAEDAALRMASLDVDPGLLQAIEELGEPDRSLVVLVALEDYPLAAAAEALGMSLDATRSRWQRIRKRLSATTAAGQAEKPHGI